MIPKEHNEIKHLLGRVRERMDMKQGTGKTQKEGNYERRREKNKVEGRTGTRKQLEQERKTIREKELELKRDRKWKILKGNKTINVNTHKSTHNKGRETGTEMEVEMRGEKKNTKKTGEDDRREERERESERERERERKRERVRERERRHCLFT